MQPGPFHEQGQPSSISDRIRLVEDATRLLQRAHNHERRQVNADEVHEDGSDDFADAKPHTHERGDRGP